MSPQLNQAITDAVLAQARRAARRLAIFESKRDFDSSCAANGAVGKLAGMFQLYQMISEPPEYKALIEQVNSNHREVWDILYDQKGEPDDQG